MNRSINRKPADYRAPGWRSQIAVSLSLCLTLGVAVAQDDSAFPASLPHGFGAAFSDADNAVSSTQNNGNRRVLEQTLKPGQIMIEVDPDLVSHTSRWDFEPQETDFPDLLGRIVRPLETITELRNGRIISGSGTGFAVGSYLLTALHNLQKPDHVDVVNHFTLLDGAPVKPSAAFPEFDVAVLDIPAASCAGLCNHPVAYSELNEIYPDQQVNWVQLNGDESTELEARIVGFAALADARQQQTSEAGNRCADNLVVLIDLPFERGSSGGPVVDKETGKLLGIIQGTLSEMTLASGVSSPGFFKPMACIAGLFGLASD